MRILLFSTLFFGFILSAGCQPAEARSASGGGLAYTNLDAAAFRAKMADDNVVILDVRTPQETAQGMIEGAIEIDLRSPDFAQRVAELDKTKTYLVYCRSGRRSVTACNMMAEQGFSDLYNLLGGYLVW